MAEQNTHQAGIFPNDQPTRWSSRAIGKAEIVRSLINLHPIPPELMAEACARAATLLNKQCVPPQTIYNWIRDFRAGGNSALEHKPHRDRGASTLHPDLRQFIFYVMSST